MKEKIIKIKDIKNTDLVFCPDGTWKKIEVLKIHKPKSFYKIIFENNSFIKCSGDHSWTLYDSLNTPFTVETKTIFKEKLFGFSCGVKNGPSILNIKRIKREPARCITIKNSKDYLFEVLSDFEINKEKEKLIKLIEKRKIFTHNCQQRLVCGKLGSIASRMALGNQQATAINGEQKGAGMVSSQGINANIQFYFEDPEWIEKWFQDRGLTKKGWEKDEDPDRILDTADFDLGEDEEITMEQNKTKIEFQNVEKEIDKNRDQKFEEI